MNINLEIKFINDSLSFSDGLEKNDFELPVEIWNHIFKQLDTKDRKSFTNVSKQFREIAIKNQQIENKEFLNFLEEKDIISIKEIERLRNSNDNLSFLYFKKSNRLFKKQLYHLLKSEIFLISEFLKKDFKKHFPFNSLSKIFDAISCHQSNERGAIQRKTKLKNLFRINVSHKKNIQKVIRYEKKFNSAILYDLYQLILSDTLDEKKIEKMLKLLSLYGSSCSTFHKSLKISRHMTGLNGNIHEIIISPSERYSITNCHISILIYCLGKYVSRKKSINERCMELYWNAVSKIDRQTLNAIRGNAEEYDFLIEGLKSISKINKQILSKTRENSEEYNFLLGELEFVHDYKRKFYKLISKNIKDLKEFAIIIKENLIKDMKEFSIKEFFLKHGKEIITKWAVDTCLLIIIFFSFRFLLQKSLVFKHRENPFS